MKVLHLISGGDVGGAKTHVLSLLSSLREHIDAQLVCFRDGEFADDARALNIPTHIVSSGIASDVRTLRQMITENNFDIIHCHGSRANFMAMLLRSQVKVPFVTTVHSDYKLDYLGRFAARLTYGVLNSIALRRFDYHIGVSDTMANLLISRGFSPENIYTIYNGIDYSANVSSVSRQEFFSRFGIDAKDDWVIASIAARLNPVKDIATLIKALGKISTECPMLHLAIAGDGEQADMLRELAESLGIADKVHFLGWIDGSDDLFAASDINTLTSLSETFPYALTEGARYYLPAISSNVGGVSHLIRHGKSGYLFTPGDVDSLARHLKTLCLDEKLRHQMGQSLGKTARELFSLEATRDTQLNIYRSILKRRQYASKRSGVTICGAYGQGNAGDDAILEAIIASMRSLDPDMPIRVLSKRPKETARAYKVQTVYTFALPAYRKAMRRSLLYINGGGSLIQNVTSRRSLWFYLSTLKTAKKLGCATMMYGCGIGPVNGNTDRKRTAQYLNSYVDTITLREQRSLDELMALNITKPEIALSADPAVTLKPADSDTIDALMTENGMEPQGKYIAFSLRKWTGFSSKAPVFAAAADYAYEKYGLIPVFIPINHLNDPSAARSVTERMKAPSVVLDTSFTSSEIIGLYSRMQALISMRLHALVFASGTGIAMAAASYDPKVEAFMEYAGHTGCIDFSAADETSLKKLVDDVAASERGILAERSRQLLEAEGINAANAAKLMNI